MVFWGTCGCVLQDLGLAVLCGWGSPDLVSTFILTDLTGSCSRPKTPSKTCAPQRASPVAGATLFYSFSPEYCCCRCPGNCSVSSRAVGRSGVAAQEKTENVIILLELRIQKKRMRSRVKNWPGIRPRFWCLLVLAHFSKAWKTGSFLGLHFGVGEPLSSPFLEPRTERPFLQRCS